MRKDVNEIKSLIKSKRNIINIIKQKINNLFNKEKIDHRWLEEFRKANTNTEFINNKIEIDDEEKETIRYMALGEYYSEENFVTNDNIKEKLNKSLKSEIKSKEEFFETYSKVKKNEIELENISLSELLKINEVLKKEIEVKREKYGIDEYEELEEEIEQLEKEYKILTEKLKKLEDKK